METQQVEADSHSASESQVVLMMPTMMEVGDDAACRQATQGLKIDKTERKTLSVCGSHCHNGDIIFFIIILITANAINLLGSPARTQQGRHCSSVTVTQTISALTIALRPPKTKMDHRLGVIFQNGPVESSHLTGAPFHQRNQSHMEHARCQDTH